MKYLLFWFLLLSLFFSLFFQTTSSRLEASGRLEENDGDRERDCSIFASLLVRSQEQGKLLKYHLRRSVLQNAQFSSHESHVFSKYNDLLSVLFCNGH